jgi:hypothetical protein
LLAIDILGGFFEGAKIGEKGQKAVNEFKGETKKGASCSLFIKMNY